MHSFEWETNNRAVHPRDNPLIERPLHDRARRETNGEHEVKAEMEGIRQQMTEAKKNERRSAL